MNIIILVLFLLRYLTITQSSELPEMEYKEGVKVDAKYNLPQVNLSVGDGNHTVVPASLARVLNFYNTEKLAAKWQRTKHFVTPSCRKDVELYLEGLSKTENWALKMDDASGRYSTGWFWGNHYWTGSQSLCENITPNSKSIIVESEQNRSRVSREAEVSKIPSSPSQAVGYVMGPLKYSSLPPFPVGFFMMRINLNTSFTTEEKIVHIGLCLPYVCTESDVKTILEETSKASFKVNVKVELMRSHHNRFNIWEDRTFIILCAVTSLVVVCLIIGTSYDFYLEYCENKRKLGQTHLKLDMSMPDTKTKNGMYIVNNTNANNNLEESLESTSKIHHPRPRTVKSIIRKHLVKPESDDWYPRQIHQ